MPDDNPKPSAESDAEIEREIRRGRKFTLADAIGRMAGPGAMKGASPVAGQQEATAEIQEYLNQHLQDGVGVLSGVLLRKVKESDVLLNDADHPLVALADYVRRVLNSEYGLKELVREADVQWGRTFEERPYFEQEGCPPSENDPYTLESVRAALTHLVERLNAAKP